MNEKLKLALDGIYDTLSESQKEKIKDCKTPDELSVFAGREGIELPDEALDYISGGCGDSDNTADVKCPMCGSKTHMSVSYARYQSGGFNVSYTCNNPKCKYEFVQ